MLYNFSAFTRLAGPLEATDDRVPSRPTDELADGCVAIIRWHYQHIAQASAAVAAASISDREASAPLPWTDLEKTEGYFEIIAARQHPCELISQLHRQPLALEVHVEDAPIDDPPIDGRSLAVGKDDAAAHDPDLSACCHKDSPANVLE